MSISLGDVTSPLPHRMPTPFRLAACHMATRVQQEALGIKT